MEGVTLDMPCHASDVPPATRPKTIFLIEMRRSGKPLWDSTLPAHLGFRSLADAVFEQPSLRGAGVNIKEFVRTHGWERFREEELAVFKRLVAEHINGKPTAKPAVISLGGGIGETPEARALFQELSVDKDGQAVVSHVVRALKEILVYLGEETARPVLGEPVAEVFARRAPWLCECSEYDFVDYTHSLVPSHHHVGTEGRAS